MCLPSRPEESAAFQKRAALEGESDQGPAESALVRWLTRRREHSFSHSSRGDTKINHAVSDRYEGTLQRELFGSFILTWQTLAGPPTDPIFDGE